MSGYLSTVGSETGKVFFRRTSHLTNKRKLHPLCSVSKQHTMRSHSILRRRKCRGRLVFFLTSFECSRHLLESFITEKNRGKQIVEFQAQPDCLSYYMFDQRMNNQLPFGKQNQSIFCSVVSPSYFAVSIFVTANIYW